MPSGKGNRDTVGLVPAGGRQIVKGEGLVPIFRLPHRHPDSQMKRNRMFGYCMVGYEEKENYRKKIIEL